MSAARRRLGTGPLPAAQASVDPAPARLPYVARLVVDQAAVDVDDQEHAQLPRGRRTLGTGALPRTGLQDMPQGK